MENFNMTIKKKYDEWAISKTLFYFMIFDATLRYLVLLYNI